MSDINLVKLDECAKPATVLVEKITNAVGGDCKPFQVVRLAKAEAEAELIRTGSEGPVTDLHRRAVSRFVAEEAKKQANIESITAQALPLVDEAASPQTMEDDWITNFFDKSRIVSNPAMQQLWSRVLAGEANLPGTFAKRTVNVLADLDKRDADLFTTLCGFGWMIDDNVVPLVFDVQNRIYTGQAVTFASLAQLEALGLVTLGDVAGFRRVELPEKVTVFYYGRPSELTFPNGSDNELQLGKVLLTQAGQELAAICGSKPVEGFREFMLAKWEKEGFIASRDTTASCGTAP